MNQGVRARAFALATAAGAAVVVLAGHRPAAPAASGDDPASLVAGVAAWAAWALVLYLLAGLGAAAAAHLRFGPAGRGGRGSSFTPAVVRRVVDIVVGATATAAAVALVPGAAFADAGHGSVTVAQARHHPVAAPLDWPALVARRASATADDAVVVRAGDSLWSITARRLGPGATAAQIAAAWPRVYAANRAAIGTDPDLIHPGQRLTVPPTTGGPR